jgi:hypothetical protein
MFTTQAKADTLRTVGFAAIAAASGAFIPVGPPQAFPARIICFTNTTNEDVIFSMDGTTDQLIVAAGGFKLFDITTNHRPVNQDDFCFANGTQWYVRGAIAPTSGSVYIEIVYAQPV